MRDIRISISILAALCLFAAPAWAVSPGASSAKSSPDASSGVSGWFSEAERVNSDLDKRPRIAVNPLASSGNNSSGNDRRVHITGSSGDPNHLYYSVASHPTEDFSVTDITQTIDFYLTSRLGHDMVVGRDGTIHLVWISTRSDGAYAINYNKKGLSDNSWSWELLFWPAPVELKDPAIALDSSGNPHVVWTALVDGNHVLLYRYFNGSEWLPAPNPTDGWLYTPLSTWAIAGLSEERSTYTPDIVVDSQNKVRVVWVEKDDYNLDHVFYREKSSPGSWGETQKLFWTNTTDAYPQIAVDSQDNLHTIYLFRAANSNSVLYYRWWDGAYQELDILTDYTKPARQRPAISIDNNNRIHIAYSYDHNDNGTYSLFYQYGSMVYSDTSVDWSSAQMLNDTAAARWPSIATDSDNNTYLAFQKDERIYYRFGDNTNPTISSFSIRAAGTTVSSSGTLDTTASTLTINYSGFDLLSGIDRVELIRGNTIVATNDDDETSFTYTYDVLEWGTYNFKIRVYDRAGNYSASSLITVNRTDTVPPNFTFTVPDYFKDGSPELIVSDATDAISGVRDYQFAWRVNNGSWHYRGWDDDNDWSPNLPDLFAGTPDHPDYDFKAKVRDNAGNIRVITDENNALDTYDPEVTIATPSQNFYNPSVASISGSTRDFLNPTYASGVSEVKVRIRRNQNTTPASYFYYRTNGTTIGPTTNNDYDDPLVWFLADYTPPADPAASTAWSFSPAAATWLDGSSYRITVRSYDRAGNQDEEHATFTIDRTPPSRPTVEIEGQALYGLIRVSNNNPYIRAISLDDVEIAEMVAAIVNVNTPEVVIRTLDKNDLDDNSSDFGSQPLANGTYLLTVAATDSAGNTSPTFRGWFTIDATPPLIAIAHPSDEAYFRTNSITVWGVVTEESSVSVTINGISANLFGSAPRRIFSRTLFGLAEGPLSIVAVATDSAGGTNTHAIAVTIDTASPEITSFVFVGDSDNDGRPTFSYNVTDATSGITSLSVAINDALGNPVTTESVYSSASGILSRSRDSDELSTALSSGNYTVTLTATDRAGNFVASTPVSFTINTLGQPTSLDIERVTGQLKLDWDFDGDLPAGNFFRVYRSSDGSTWTQISTDPLTAEALITPRPASGYYLYGVVSTNGALESAPSNAVAAYQYTLPAGATTPVTFPSITNNDLNTLREIANDLKDSFTPVEGDILLITLDGLIYECDYFGGSWHDLNDSLDNTPVTPGTILNIGTTRAINWVVIGRVAP